MKFITYQDLTIAQQKTYDAIAELAFSAWPKGLRTFFITCPQEYPLHHPAPDMIVATWIAINWYGINKE